MKTFTGGTYFNKFLKMLVFIKKVRFFFFCRTGMLLMQAKDKHLHIFLQQLAPKPYHGRLLRLIIDPRRTEFLLT